MRIVAALTVQARWSVSSELGGHGFPPLVAYRSTTRMREEVPTLHFPQMLQSETTQSPGGTFFTVFAAAALSFSTCRDMRAVATAVDAPS